MPSAQHPNQPQLKNLESEDRHYEEILRHQLAGAEEKNFDWNHFQHVAGSFGNAMFQNELGIVPTMRVTKGLMISEPWINACVNAMQKQFLRTSFFLEKKNKDKSQTVTQHALLDYLARPSAQGESQVFFTTNNIADLVLAGNSYWFNTKDLKTKIRLPAEKVDPIIRDGRLLCYRINSADEMNMVGASIDLLPEDVTHIKYPNPFTPHVGLSMLVASCLPVLIDKYGREYVATFFLRGGSSTGIIETDRDSRDMGQLLRFAKTLMSSFGGRRNMHADKILPKGATWKATGGNFSQIGLKDILTENLGMIKAATGCSNTVLGISEGLNRATAFAEMEFFWLNTILPLQTLYCDGVKSSSLWERFKLDDTWTLKFNNAEIPYLDDFDRKLDQDAKLAATHTVNERRVRLGSEKLTSDYDKLASEMVKPQTPFNMLSFPVPDHAKAVEEGDEPPIQITESSTVDLGKFKAEEEEIITPSKATVMLFGVEFDAWGEIVIDNLSSKEAATKAIQKRKDAFAEKLADITITKAMQAYDNQIDQAVKAKCVGKFQTKESEADKQRILENLRERAKGVISGTILKNGKTNFVGYSDTAMDSVYTWIEEYLDQGLSLADTAAHIRMRWKEHYGFSENYTGQAETIVTTEFGSAVSAGQAQFGQDLASVTKTMSKEWVSMGNDGFTRESHLENESNPISGSAEDVMEERWENGLRYPRDPDGEAGEIINCRCTIRYVPGEWK